MREANFLTDKSVLVTVALPQGTPITANKLKLFFSQSGTAILKGKLITRIRFYGLVSIKIGGVNLTRVNGVTVNSFYPDPSIYITLKDDHNNTIIDSANLFDFGQLCSNTDAKGRPIYAPVRRLAAKVNWPNSYLTLTTPTPYSSANVVVAIQVSYTNAD